MPSLAVMILAGGHSRRMGQDKALLALPGGQTLLAHTIKVAQRLSSEVLLVTPWPERYEGICSRDVRIVREVTGQDVEQPSAGPLSGFVCGWQAIDSNWCLLLACDLPYLDAAVLARWWAWIQSQSALGWPTLTSSLSSQLTTSEPIASEPIASRPIASRPMASLIAGPYGWEPLCGYYHRGAWLSLEQSAPRSRAFQPWLKTLSIAPYDQVPRKMLFNCNTPADWATVSGCTVSGCTVSGCIKRE